MCDVIGLDREASQCHVGFAVQDTGVRADDPLQLKSSELLGFLCDMGIR